MNYDFYNKISISEQFESYDFISVGINGNIEKRVKFEFVEELNIYNLAFGDINELGEIDDYSISNNKDLAKVLATIAFIVKVFLEKFPNRSIYFRGTTVERTRLYRMAIGNNLDELQEYFDIYGIQSDDGIDFFTKNQDYIAFLVRKKL